MGHRFAEIAFTESVREVQQEHGSRINYATMEAGDDYNHQLGQHEAEFISARDSFYMASVSETGWPYVQHRGGPPGFVRVLDEQTIGFADFSGNRQYVSVGNFRKDDRVSLFFMDYPNRTRFKLFGRIRVLGPDESALQAELEVDDYRARVERGFLIHIEAFDWNCPQHITPRHTDAHIESLMAPLLEENRKLRAERPAVKATPAQAIGDGPLALVISGLRELTPRVRAFELRDPHGADLPVVEAGSHLLVPVPVEDGKTVIRHYSICSDPSRRDIYEIAVLRETTGRGGSQTMHAQFNIGQRLNCGLPQNHFRLHTDSRPAVLIAGGIGITPIKAMAQALKARGTDVKLHYAGRSGPEMAFRDRLMSEFGADISVYRSSDGERIDIEQVLSTAATRAVFYICGPDRLIEAFRQADNDLNIPSERIRFERFEAGPLKDSRPIALELRRSGMHIQVTAEQSILDAMLDHGLDVPYGCRAGNCKSCAVKIISGQVEHRDSALSQAERETGGLMCPCISRATSEHLVLDI